jgi:hypothetical protein
MLHSEIFGIPNAWMASSRPGHPFWVSVYSLTVQGVKDGRDPNRIEDLTGPGPLYFSAHAWWKRVKKAKGFWAWLTGGAEKLDEVVLLKSPKIYPYSWAEPSKALHVCFLFFLSRLVLR